MKWGVTAVFVAIKLTTITPLSGLSYPKARILKTTLPWASSGAAIAYPGGDFIYLFGGYDAYGLMRSRRQILRFTISTETVEIVGQLPFSKSSATTFLDPYGNIYIVGGWCLTGCNESLSVVLKFNTTTHAIEEIPTTLPFQFDTHSIVSYQKNRTTSAYVLANFYMSSAFHLFKMRSGEMERIGKFTFRESSTIEALTVIGEDVFVKVSEGLETTDVSPIYRFSPQNAKGMIYNKDTLRRHNPVGIRGLGEQPWYLIPYDTRQGVIETYDVPQNTITSYHVDHYPAVLLNSDKFINPAYTYIETLKRVYIFGGACRNDSSISWRHLSMVWTIQIFDNPATNPPILLGAAETSTLEDFTTSTRGIPTYDYSSKTAKPPTTTLPIMRGLEQGTLKKNKSTLPLLLGGAAFLLVTGIVVGAIILQRKVNRRLSQMGGTNSNEYSVQFHAAANSESRHTIDDRRQEIQESELVVSQDVLGAGYFGEVRKGLYCPLDTEETILVTVKQLRTGHVFRKDVLTEIETLKIVDHPNIIKFYGAIKNGADTSMVFEYYENGSLWSYLRGVKELTSESDGSDYHPEFLKEYILTDLTCLDTQTSKVTVKNLHRWSRQIALAMEYLGTKRIIHRDLAARNVLLDCNLQAKVSDFGLSRTLQPRSLTSGWYCYYKSKHDGALPYPWVAVEALHTQKFTVATDIWAFGVTIWEIFSLCKSSPYDGLSLQGVLKFLNAGNRLERPSNASDEIYAIMLGCWNDDPKRRQSFEVLGEHILEQTTICGHH